MNRGLHRKLTREDRFARRFYCNAQRFLRDMKRRNRRLLRRKLRKEEL